MHYSLYRWVLSPPMLYSSIILPACGYISLTEVDRDGYIAHHIASSKPRRHRPRRHQGRHPAGLIIPPRMTPNASPALGQVFSAAVVGVAVIHPYSYTLCLLIWSSPVSSATLQNQLPCTKNLDPVRASQPRQAFLAHPRLVHPSPVANRRQ